MARSKARKMADGEMKLTRDGSSKLESNATGVDVTGTVTADGLTVDGTALIENGNKVRVNAPMVLHIVNSIWTIVL